MSHPLSIGSCLVFPSGYGDCLAGRLYAVVAIQLNQYVLVELDHRRPSRARNVRLFPQVRYLSLSQEGLVQVIPMPQIPTSETFGITTKKSDRPSARLERLRPLIEAKNEILASPGPSKSMRCQSFMRQARIAHEKSASPASIGNVHGSLTSLPFTTRFL